MSQLIGKWFSKLDGWSIEFRTTTKITYHLLLDAVLKSEQNRNNTTEIPVAVIHKSGEPDSDSLVVMRLCTFRDYFINN
jgi:hypothetical protein